jgi:pimeloyl-ACP methyl ester carboxylesterase
VRRKKIRVLIVILLLIGMGSLWQAVMIQLENGKSDYPGDLINISGHNMHIFRKGTGSPSVVFTVGSGTPSSYTDYYFIQEEISKYTRTITYDRPGYGWSEPTNIPRTIEEQVKDLHKLLVKAGEKPPYILVGHSLSSLEVIHYAQVFPEEVSGIVLIDGGNPEYYADYNQTMAVTFNYFLGGVRKCGILRAIGSVGILTPMVAESTRYKGLPKELAEIDKRQFYRNLGNGTNRNEIQNMNANAKRVIEGGKLANIPLIILTSAGDKAWENSQSDLKAWSDNSKQEIVEDAGHYIHWDKPDIVIKRIKELVDLNKS